MKIIIGVALLCAIAGAPTDASAASILNQDTVAHQFKITKEGKRSRLIQVGGGRERMNVCNTGCELGFGEMSWTLTGTEQVVIGNGKIGIRRR